MENKELHHCTSDQILRVQQTNKQQQQKKKKEKKGRKVAYLRRLLSLGPCRASFF